MAHTFNPTEYAKLRKTGKVGRIKLNYLHYTDEYTIVYRRQDASTDSVQFGSIKYNACGKNKHKEIEARFRKDYPSTKGMRYQIMNVIYQ